MIGNDIVDLSHYQGHPQSRNIKFLSKVLTQQEIQLKPPNLSLNSYLWSLWGAKESVFKIIARKKTAIFSPKSIECQCFKLNRFTWQSQMRSKDQLFKVRIIKHEKYIHTIAIPFKDSSMVYFAAFPIPLSPPKAQSFAVRYRLIEQLALMGYQNISMNHFKKNQFGAPGIEGSDLSISFSHHGQWGGFAISTPYPYC